MMLINEIKSLHLKTIDHLLTAFQILMTKNDIEEDLDAVMPIYNLLEHSKNYRKTTGSLGNY